MVIRKVAEFFSQGRPVFRWTLKFFTINSVEFGCLTHSPMFAHPPAGWLCRADLYDGFRASSAAGTAAQAGKEMPACMWYLSVRPRKRPTHNQ